MKKSTLSRFGAVIAVGLLAFSVAACGDDDDKSDSSSSKKDTPTKATDSMEVSQNFGAGCDAVPKDGKGSFEGMSADPVASAASNNPVLSTLVAAVQKAELVDTLNSAENITVFAPANSAFDKIPPADLEAVLNDKAMLTKILTYHVVGEPITPDKLASGGSFKTMEGGEITISGSGEDFTVNGNSKVVCGNVKTANATVYIVDSVLMPTA